MKKLALAGLALACGFGATLAPAQAAVVGTADTSSSYPFGSSGGGYYYQQVYSAASLAGTTTINNISFYNSLSPATNTPLTDVFTIFLSTTTAAIPSFDTSAFAFPDGSFTQVFSGTLSSLVGGRLDILLSTAFNYDPSQGSLMLTVRDFTLGSGGNLFLDADKNVGVTNSRISAFPYDFNHDWSPASTTPQRRRCRSPQPGP